MSENEINETTETNETAETTEETEVEYSGRQIMCFVSKKMVPIEDTVEVEYSPGQAYRVQSKYVRYGQEAS
jgi:hypothetical protein